MPGSVDHYRCAIGDRDSADASEKSSCVNRRVADSDGVGLVRDAGITNGDIITARGEVDAS